MQEVVGSFGDRCGPTLHSFNKRNSSTGTDIGVIMFYNCLIRSKSARAVYKLAKKLE
jgi:hypothetical protein